MDTKINFTEWLMKQIEERDISMREFARRGEISHTSVSNVLAGKTDPTADFCLGVARALKLKPDYVLRKSGHLPPAPDTDDPKVSEAMTLFSKLPAHEQERFLLFMRAIDEAQEQLEEIQEEGTPNRDTEQQNQIKLLGGGSRTQAEPSQA